jgi:homoserine dehydrogenase
MKKVRIALLGCGTVGGGVLRLLSENRAHLSARVGAELEVVRVLVRDASRVRVEACQGDWLTTDPEAVFADPSVDIVAEVMGGQEPAKSYIERAIAQGKSVVSANKALLAAHGPLLLSKAAEKGVDLAFEASVGGGIPIIRTLRDALTSDRVTSVHGILNGTCNYILTRMRQEGASFKAVLEDAQALGYAEADPSLDVDGHDAAQKLIVLCMLAFGAVVNERDMYVEGIRAIDELDFEFAERFGFTIKHVALAHDRGEKLELRAHPTLLPAINPLSGVHGVLNGAFIQGRALGPCLLVGRGAGEMPTAVSVVADLVDVARARVEGAGGLATRAIRPVPRPLLPMAEVEARYYLRFEVRDVPGVLAAIAGALGDQAISVAHMVQEKRRSNKASDDADWVPILMITHRSREGRIQTALDKINQFPFMRSRARLIRIEDNEA